MQNEKNLEELRILQEKVKTLLKNSESELFYNTWADAFEIEQIGDEGIVIGYHGDLPFKKFKKECQKILWTDICILSGYNNNMKIINRQNGKGAKKVKAVKSQKNIKAIKFLAIGLVFACIAASVGVVMCNYIINRSFRESFYTVSSLKVNNSIRVIQISDLHNCNYGNNNRQLLERIEKLDPDLIICTGDIVDSLKSDISGIEVMGETLSKVAPLYYVYGNNEVEKVYNFPFTEKELDKRLGFNSENRDGTKLLELPDDLEKALEASGFNVLKNQKDTITVGTTKVDVYGVLNSNPSSFWSYTGQSFSDYLNEDSNNFKITAIHEPFIFEEFEPEYWGDLMLAGHTHGGEFRVPVLGPLYTNEGGLFPERKGCFVYGRYDVAGRPLIVSSGLENKNPLRINNQPELVIIDINKF